jgi:hypothetical protein
MDLSRLESAGLIDCKGLKSVSFWDRLGLPRLFSTLGCSRIVPATLGTLSAQGLRKSVRQRFRYAMSPQSLPDEGSRRLRGARSALTSRNQATLGIRNAVLAAYKPSASPTPGRVPHLICTLASQTT